MQENEASAQNTSTPIVDQAKETAKQAVQQGQEVAVKAVGNVRDQVKTQVTTQKDKAATALSDVANALLLTGSHLRDQGKDSVVDYSDRLAEGITNASNYLKQHEVEDLVSDVNDFARSKPALFVGTALVLGVLASRFFKSSNQSSSRLTTNTTPNIIPPQDATFAASQNGNSVAPPTGGINDQSPKSDVDALTGTDSFGGTSIGVGSVGDDLESLTAYRQHDELVTGVAYGNLDPEAAGSNSAGILDDELDDDDELVTQDLSGTRSSHAA